MFGFSLNLGGGGHGHGHHGHGHGHGYGHGHGLGGMFNIGFNRWNRNNNYHKMNGYCNIDYSNGWNPMQHDQMLTNNIRIVFQRYDRNRSGQLEGQEFFYAYRDLCLMMGIAPPESYQ